VLVVKSLRVHAHRPTAVTLYVMHESSLACYDNVEATELAANLWKSEYQERNMVPLQKIWPFYKTSEKHHIWDIYMP